MWKFIIPAAALAIYYGKQKKDQLLEGLSFEPVDIKFDRNSAGLVSTRFNIYLKAFNKSDVPVPVRSISGKVFMNGSELGTYQVQKSFTIPANGNVTMEVTVTAGNLALFIAIFSFIKTGNTPRIIVQGGVFTLLGTAPFELEFKSIKIFDKKQ